MPKFVVCINLTCDCHSHATGWEAQLEEIPSQNIDGVVWVPRIDVRKLIREIESRAKEEAIKERGHVCDLECHFDSFDAGILRGKEEGAAELIHAAKVCGAVEEREEISDIIKSRLPNPMTEKEKEEYHCEAAILHWGTKLLEAINPTP